MTDMILKPMFSFVDEHGNKVIAIDTIEEVAYSASISCNDFNVSRDKMTAVKIVTEQKDISEINNQ